MKTQEKFVMSTAFTMAAYALIARGEFFAAIGAGSLAVLFAYAAAGKRGRKESALIFGVMTAIAGMSLAEGMKGIVVIAFLQGAALGYLKDVKLKYLKETMILLAAGFIALLGLAMVLKTVYQLPLTMGIITLAFAPDLSLYVLRKTVLVRHIRKETKTLIND